MPTDSLIGWGIRFTATSYVLRVTANATTENLTFPAAGSLSTTSDYYVTGDGQSDDLVTILAACIASHSQIATCTGTLTSFRVVMNADVQFNLLWSNGSTTLDETIFGWTNSDTGLGDPLTAPNLPQGLWRPQRPINFDSRDRQPIVSGMAQSISGAVRVSDFGTPLKERDVNWVYLPQTRILTEYVDATEPYGSFEYAWLNSIRLGRVTRLYEDEDTINSSSYTAYRIRSLAEPMRRNDIYPVFWDVNLPLRRSS